jgi:hypothetical protein
MSQFNSQKHTNNRSFGKKNKPCLNDNIGNDSTGHRDVMVPISLLSSIFSATGSQHTTSNVPIQTTTHSSSITNDYISLIIEHQKLMSLKFDYMEQTLSKLLKENQNLKDSIEKLDDKSDMVVDQIDNLCGFIAEKLEITEHGHEHIEQDNMHGTCECDKPSVDSCTTKADGSIKGNPFEMLLNQLAGIKPTEKVEENDLEEEYDVNEKIYSDEVKDVPNLEEFSKIPKNISDLIEMGNIYTSVLETATVNATKKKKKLKIGKQSDVEEVLQIGTVINDIYELEGKKYAINLEKVVNLMKPLMKLNNMIGMKNVKESVFEMILYYLQGFETRNQNMLHSVIEGPPGTGKTQLGKILAHVYCGLGIIETSKFKYVRATDLIGDHVGATKHMTQKVIDDANGGVLFIDEAYALSSNDNKDPYGKECIDTLNFNLSENKKKLIVIIAGYPDQLDKYFFAFNPGLQRRFPFRHRIDGYSAEELRDIFIDKLKRFKWKLDNSLDMDDLTKFFKSNKNDFANFGGDIENLFKKCQYAHSNRVVGKNPSIRKKFTLDDIQNGFNKFKECKRVDNDSGPKYPHMYI